MTDAEQPTIEPASETTLTPIPTAPVAADAAPAARTRPPQPLAARDAPAGRSPPSWWRWSSARPPRSPWP